MLRQCPATSKCSVLMWGLLGGSWVVGAAFSWCGHLALLLHQGPSWGRLTQPMVLSPAPPEPTSPLGQSHCREEMNQLLTPPRGRASQGFIGSFHAPSVAGGGGPWEELLCIFYRKGHRPEKSLQINGQAGDRGPRDNQERPGRSDGPGLG